MYGRVRIPWLTVALTLLALAAAVDGRIASAWAYDRGSIAGGELWRLVTGHLTHWNGDHLLWDSLMFLALGMVVESRSRWGFAAVFFGSALAISAGLWLVQASVAEYRGLSGIDSALFASAAIGLYLDGGRSHDRTICRLAAAALAGFFAKVFYELMTGHTLFVDSAGAGFIPMPAAHLVGAAVGLAWIFCSEPKSTRTAVEA